MDFAQSSLGTPFFLSPEICKGEKYSYKTDIWMLGCVLFELCSLQKPFQAENLYELMSSIINKPYVDLPKNYSNDIHEIVKIMLKKDPNDRPFIHELLETDIIKKRMIEFNISDHSSLYVEHNKKVSLHLEINDDNNYSPNKKLIKTNSDLIIDLKHDKENEKENIQNSGKEKVSRRQIGKINKKYDSMGNAALNSVLMEIIDTPMSSK